MCGALLIVCAEEVESQDTTAGTVVMFEASDAEIMCRVEEISSAIRASVVIGDVLRLRWV